MRAVRWFIQRWWMIPALALLAIPVLWDMPAWWIDTPKGWLPDLTIYVYYLGFFPAGPLCLPASRSPADHRPALAVATGIRERARSARDAQADYRRELGGRSQSPVPCRPGSSGWKAGAIFLGGLYTWLTISGLLGLFQRVFRWPRGVGKYLADASYWCYLAGFPIQALQVYFAPWRCRWPPSSCWSMR